MNDEQKKQTALDVLNNQATILEQIRGECALIRVCCVIVMALAIITSLISCVQLSQ